MNKQLINTLQEKEERMIEIRRYLHQHPELSFKNRKRQNISLISTKIKIAK